VTRMASSCISSPHGAAPEPTHGYSARMPTIQLWLFMVTDPLTGKRRSTRYRLTMEEARERYVDPEPVPYSLERREVNEQAHVRATARPAVIREYIRNQEEEDKRLDQLKLWQ
jgi:hypothetical protein